MWKSRLFVAVLLMSSPFVLESAFEAYGLTLAFGPQMIFFSIVHTGGLLVLLLLASGACLLLASVCGFAVLAVRRLRKTRGTVPSRVVALTTTALSMHAVVIVTYGWWSTLGVARLVSLAALVFLTWTVARVFQSYRLTKGWTLL